MSKRSKTVGRQSAQTGTFEIVHRVEQHWVLRLLGGIIRLRAELTTVAVLTMLWHTLDAHVWPGTGAWLILAGLTLVVLAYPRTRRMLTRRVWAVLTRHRLRACLVACRVMTHDGRLPRILWSRPSPVGERIWLWLRPGLCATHVERSPTSWPPGVWAKKPGSPCPPAGPC